MLDYLLLIYGLLYCNYINIETRFYILKALRNLICIAMVLAVSLSSATVVGAENSNTIAKSKQNVTVPSKAVNNKVGSLLKKNTVPSQSIEVKEGLPSKYSSVDKGYVTSIKDQGSHNTCWTFSAMATLETALLKNGFGVYDFSEEHLDSWSTTRSNGFGWIRDLNSGGYSDMAMGYFTSWQGPRLESDIPFGYATGKTFESVNALGTTEYGVTGIVKLPKDVATVKTAVYDYGAVSASFASNGIFFNDDRTAAFAYQKFSSSSSIEGHAITVVGWDDNYSKTNFKTGCQPQNNGAWLCKNSWGDYNSLDGYFWISYEDPYLFGEELSEPFAVTDVQKIEDNIKLYQVEEFGSTYDFNLTVTSNGVQSSVKDMTYINKFDFTEQYGSLDGVMFETMAVGADYSVYFIPVDRIGVPVNDESQWVELASGVIDYAGYRTIDTNYTLPYSKGAIGVTIDGTGSNVASTFGCDEWLTTVGGELVFYPDVDTDASYLQYRNRMYNLSDFYSDMLGDDIGSNFVIKALTSSDKGVAKYDINNNSQTGLEDLIYLKRYMLSTIDFNRNQTYSADIDSDGKVTLIDTTLMARELLN